MVLNILYSKKLWRGEELNLKNEFGFSHFFLEQKKWKFKDALNAMDLSSSIHRTKFLFARSVLHFSKNNDFFFEGESPLFSFMQEAIANGS